MLRFLGSNASLGSCQYRHWIVKCGLRFSTTGTPTSRSQVISSYFRDYILVETTQQCGNALNYQQAGLKDAARQLEQAAQNHTEIAVAQSTAQTQANMIADLLVTEKKAENPVSLQQL